MLSEFFYIVSELKKVSRKGWKEKVGIPHPESVADHSYGTAIMAMVLSDYKSMDAEKMMKMALLHDLAESITGDFIPGEISRENKTDMENQVMQEIFSKLPPVLVEKYTLIWDEYQKGVSQESILLHEIDKLEMAVQAIKYSSEGFSKEILQEFIDSARKEINSKELLAVLDALSYK
ncbi:MAG TPA: HD domain-containing protein [Candidatus Nitrosotalea sp.]|nr:HD domain-containing protein [Nitrososphaerota archaeon]HKU32890.1 HD domain-containing protein [Candidatus Nitrosotalea sp.]